MEKSYLTNIQEKIIAENVIFHNLYISKYVQSKKTCPKMKFIFRIVRFASLIQIYQILCYISAALKWNQTFCSFPTVIT